MYSENSVLYYNVAAGRSLTKEMLKEVEGLNTNFSVFKMNIYRILDPVLFTPIFCI